jgi:hypothetical protein
MNRSAKHCCGAYVEEQAEASFRHIQLSCTLLTTPSSDVTATTSHVACRGNLRGAEQPPQRHTAFKTRAGVEQRKFSSSTRFKVSNNRRQNLYQQSVTSWKLSKKPEALLPRGRLPKIPKCPNSSGLRYRSLLRVMCTRAKKIQRV